jgi:hypothetical protein
LFAERTGCDELTEPVGQKDEDDEEAGQPGCDDRRSRCHERKQPRSLLADSPRMQRFDALAPVVRDPFAQRSCEPYDDEQTRDQRDGGQRDFRCRAQDCTGIGFFLRFAPCRLQAPGSGIGEILGGLA